MGGRFISLDEVLDLVGLMDGGECISFLDIGDDRSVLFSDGFCC